MSCGVGHRHGSDPMWLWHRPAAAAPIQPLAWELLYAAGVALKKTKKKRKCTASAQGYNHPTFGRGDGELPASLSEGKPNKLSGDNFSSDWAT